MEICLTDKLNLFLCCSLEGDKHLMLDGSGGKLGICRQLLMFNGLNYFRNSQITRAVDRPPLNT